jgi:hypothetical protein
MVVPTRRRDFSPQFSNGDSIMPGKTESDEELSTLTQRRPGPNGKDIQRDKALLAPRQRISINSPGIENFGSNEGSTFFQSQGSFSQSPGEHFSKKPK